VNTRPPCRSLDGGLAGGVQEMEARLVRRHPDRSAVDDGNPGTGEFVRRALEPLGGALGIAGAGNGLEGLEEKASAVDAASLGSLPLCR